MGHFMLQMPLKSLRMILKSETSPFILIFGDVARFFGQKYSFSVFTKTSQNVVFSNFKASYLGNNKSPQVFPLHGPVDRFQNEDGAS